MCLVQCRTGRALVNTLPNDVLRASRGRYGPAWRLILASRDQIPRGVVKEAEELVLHPYLRDSSSPLAVLQTSTAPDRRDNSTLLSGQGSLPENRWAFCETLKDRTTKQFQNHFELPLLVTGDWADVLLLRFFGFPATPARGLEDFHRNGIDTFCGLLRIPRRISSGDGENPGSTGVIADFNDPGSLVCDGTQQ